MDLGEKADLCDYEKIHRLIESTYKNIVKNFNPGVKQLIVLGKALQKTIQNVGTSFKAYNECLYELARSAESCRGSTKEIGLGLLQLTDSEKELQQQLADSIKVFHAELLIPLKAKQENEFRHVQVLYDKYLTGHKFHSNNLRKAQNVLEKYKKKTKSKSGQKEMERSRHMKECKRRLEEYLRKNLRLALLEERKRYCYFFNRLLCVVEDKVNKSTKTNEMLMEGLRNWPELCRNPHILPTATQQIIHDFGFSDDSCDLDDDPSGDGEHGDAKCGTRVTLNPRDLRQIDYDWSPKRGSLDTTMKETHKKHGATLSTIHTSLDSKGTETAEVKRHHTTTPGVLCAIYPYVAATETQLSLEANDVIRICGEVQNGWLFGCNTRTNKEGWFPLSFTDFSGELLQSKSTNMRGHRSLTNIRNTWHTEVCYDVERVSSRCSEEDAADVSAGSTHGTTARCTPSSETVDHQVTRPKFVSRRIFPMEPISEQIPPPEEFRDRLDQANFETDPVAKSKGLVSAAEERVTDNVEKGNPTQNKSSTTVKTEEVELKATKVHEAESQPIPEDVTKGLPGVVQITENKECQRRGPDQTSDLPQCVSVRKEVDAENFGLLAPAVLPPPPPPSPLSPPAPPESSCLFPRLSRNSASPLRASYSLLYESSPGSNSHAGQAQPLVSKSTVGSVDGAVHYSLPRPRVKQAPPPPPPPPPVPLPPGSYHSARSEYFARPRLRKTASMDSTKTN